MKKIIFTVFMLATLIFVGNSPADTIQINRYKGYYSGNGGEFNITGWGAAAPDIPYSPLALVNGGFESFCLEKNETVSMGGSYVATYGGSVTTSQDTISVGTAFLYDQFSQGILGGYDYTGKDRDKWAKSLQQTIWELEDEVSRKASIKSKELEKFISDPGKYWDKYLKNQDKYFEALLVTTFGSWDNAKNDVSKDNDYGIGVLNLTTMNGGPAQDQLVRIPGPGPVPKPVPEPGTMLLLGLGLLGLAASRRAMKYRLTGDRG